MAAGSIVIDLLMKTGSFETDTGRAEKRLQQFKKEAQDAGAAIGAAFLGFASAAAVLVKGSIDAFDATAKLASSVGITSESLSALSYAADLSGISQEELGSSLARLARSASDAASGAKEQAAAFDLLGVSVKGADGQLKNTDVLLAEIADKFASYKDGAAKTALAQEVFGKSGAKLIPLLNAGAAGIEELKKEAEALGLVFGGDTGPQAELFNDNISRLRGAVKGLSNGVAIELLPTLSNLSTKLLDSAKSSGVLDQAARAGAAGVKILLSVGVIVGAAFKTLGEILGGVAGALVALFSGRFSEAFNIAKNVTADFVGNISGAASAVSTIWDDAAIKVLSKAEDNSNKLSAPVGKAAGKIKAAGKSIKDETAKIFDDIEKQIAAINREVGIFGKTDTQVKLIDLQAGGATPDQLSRAGASLGQLDALKKQDDAAKLAADRLKELEAQGRATFQGTRSPIEELNIELGRQQDILNALGPVYQDTYFRAVEAAQAAFEGTQKVTSELDEFSKNAAKNIQGALGEGLANILDGNFKDIGSNFKKMIDRIVVEAAAAQIARTLFGDLVSGGKGSGILGTVLSSFGSALGFGGAKAGGGDVMAGRSYLVGEQGPEMFVPRTMGAIVPNAAAAGGGGNVTNISVSVAMPAGGNRATALQFGADAARQIGRASSRNG